MQSYTILLLVGASLVQLGASSLIGNVWTKMPSYAIPHPFIIEPELKQANPDANLLLGDWNCPTKGWLKDVYTNLESDSQNMYEVECNGYSHYMGIDDSTSPPTVEELTDDQVIIGVDFVDL